MSFELVGSLAKITIKTSDVNVSHYLTEDDVAALSDLFQRDTEWTPFDWPKETKGYWTAIGFGECREYSYGHAAAGLKKAGKHEDAERFRRKANGEPESKGPHFAGPAGS